MFTAECLSCVGIRTPNIFAIASGISAVSNSDIRSMMFLSIAGIITSLYFKPVALPFLYSITPVLSTSSTTTPPGGILSWVKVFISTSGVPPFHADSLITSDLVGIPFSISNTRLYILCPNEDTNANASPGTFSLNVPLLKYVKNNCSNFLAVTGLFKLYFCEPFSNSKNANILELAPEAIKPFWASFINAARFGVIAPFSLDNANSSNAVSKLNTKFLLFLYFNTTLWPTALLYSLLTSPTVITSPSASNIPGISTESSCSEVISSLIWFMSVIIFLLDGLITWSPK